MRQNSYTDINNSLDRVTKARKYAIKFFNLLKKNFDENIYELEHLSEIVKNQEVKKELLSPNATDDSRLQVLSNIYKNNKNKEISSLSKEMCTSLIERNCEIITPT